MASSHTFDGASFDPSRDGDRLSSQYDAVYALMRDGQSRTLAEISRLTGCPQQSVSARLRDLRKPRFGGHDVVRAYLSDGVWSYRVELAEPGTTRRLF